MPSVARCADALTMSASQRGDILQFLCTSFNLDFVNAQQLFRNPWFAQFLDSHILPHHSFLDMNSYLDRHLKHKKQPDLYGLPRESPCRLTLTDLSTCRIILSCKSLPTCSRKWAPKVNALFNNFMRYSMRARVKLTCRLCLYHIESTEA